MSDPFWEKPLSQLSDTEWEALCDGCAQCCLVKLQDEDTEEIFATDVVCRFLERENGRCGVYAQRSVHKPDCFVIERGNARHMSWLPKTCAYRLRYENKPLPDWHPLIAGGRSLMREAGIAAGDWSISEEDIGDADLTARVIFSLDGDH